MKRWRLSDSGFTLVELATVIAVIGILVTIVIVTYGNWQQRTRDSQRKSDLEQIATAVKGYVTWNGNFVTSCGNSGDGFIGAASTDTTAGAGPYASSSVISCLRSSGYLKPTDGVDPSGCRFNSGGSCGSGNPTKAYMKATCMVNGVQTVYLMAYLETGTANNSTIDALCGKGWGTAYGMNYYITMR